MKNFKKIGLISTIALGAISSIALPAIIINVPNNGLNNNHNDENSYNYVTNINTRNTLNTTPNYDVINNEIQVSSDFSNKYASELTLNDKFSLLSPENVIGWFKNLPSDYGEVNSLPVIVGTPISNDKNGTLRITFKLTYAILDGVYDINTEGFEQTQITINLVGFLKRLPTTFEAKIPDKSLNATNIVEYFSGSLNTEILESKVNTFLNLNNKPNNCKIRSVSVLRNTYEETVIQFTYNQVNVEQSSNVVLQQNYPIQLKIKGFKPNWQSVETKIMRTGDSDWIYNRVITNYDSSTFARNNENNRIIFLAFIVLLGIIFIVVFFIVWIINRKKPTISVSL